MENLVNMNNKLIKKHNETINDYNKLVRDFNDLRDICKRNYMIDEEEVLIHTLFEEKEEKGEK